MNWTQDYLNPLVNPWEQWEGPIEKYISEFEDIKKAVAQVKEVKEELKPSKLEKALQKHIKKKELEQQRREAQLRLGVWKKP